MISRSLKLSCKYAFCILHLLLCPIAAKTSFDIKLIRTTSASYATEDTSGTSRLGDTMYFKLMLETTKDDLTLSPQNCYATNGVDLVQKYYLIKDR